MESTNLQKNGKKKLAIVNSSSLSVSYGGVAPFIKNLDPYFQDTYDVTYIVLPQWLQKIEFLPKRLVFLIYMFLQIGRIRKFDFVFSHVPEGSYAVSFSGVPYLHIFHGNFNPMSQSRFWFGKYFIPLFAFMEKRIIRTAVLKYTVGAPRPGINKILNPINHSIAVKPAASRSGFIFAGRLEKIKNIDRIIRVYAQLPPEIREANTLYIAGKGTQRSYLESVAVEKGVEKQVVFLGSLSNDELVEADSARKILLMASSQEGFPMAIAEAFSTGVPVISTDTGDIKSFLKSDYNGFLLPIEFEEAVYVDCIKKILSDYDRFAANALESAKVFKAANVAASVIGDINKVIGN